MFFIVKSDSVQSKRAPQRGSRRERERTFRIGLVVEAAEEVFAARGFQGASVEEIASRAEVAIGTLYKLVGGKEEVFAAVIHHRQNGFLSGLEKELRRAGLPEEKLDRLVTFTFQYFEAHRAAFRLYIDATQGLTWYVRSQISDEVFDVSQRIVAFVAEILREGEKAQGWGTMDDPDTAAMAMVGALNALLALRHRRQDTHPIDEDLAFARKLILRFVGAEAKMPSRSGE